MTDTNDRRTADADSRQREVVAKALGRIRTLKARVAQLEQARREPIAIVAMGCRYPMGVDSPQAFWRLLRDGVDAVTSFAPSRWPESLLGGADEAGRMVSLAGARLDDVEHFDARFFGISPREAERMDPQQRLLLEVTQEALERAGLETSALRGSATGVFVGAGTEDFAQVCFRDGDLESVDPYDFTGVDISVCAGRIAHTWGLQGPCMTVDTACSSSLVALHLACQSLRAGESELAIVGGVNVILDPAASVYLSRARAMSPTGRCHTFTAQADGYVRGEGCAVLVLEPLSRALQRGAPILATVLGSAVGHDGPASGLTVPNAAAQSQVVRAALEQAGLSPAEVGYIEAHGTGTPLGDPLEFRALTEVFAPRPAAAPLHVGSHKTNLGHLEAAAGLTGACKLALALMHGTIPPHLHLADEGLNPAIDLDAIPARIPTQCEPWPAIDGRRIGGVSSFGISGTNVHVVLGEAPVVEPRDETGDETAEGDLPILLPWSARTPVALEGYARALLARLESVEGKPELIALSHSLVRHRDHHRLRAMVGGEDAGALRSALERWIERHDAPTPCVEPLRGVVFVCSGQGGQWTGMGAELMARAPAFTSTIEALEAAMSPWVDWSLSAVLRGDEGAPSLECVDIVQPAIFAMQVALARLWAAWGVRPVALVGHSMGEVAAACIAGALSLEDAARVICQRSRIAREQAAPGAMLVTELDEAEANALLESLGEDTLSIAALNGPRNVVLSGSIEAIDAARARLEADDAFVRRVEVDYASHSPMMDALKGPLLEALDGLQPRTPTVALLSTVTGSRLDADTPMDADYWVRNLRQPVRFAPMVDQALTDQRGRCVVVELGPHPVLTWSVQQLIDARDDVQQAAALGTMRRDRGALDAMTETLSTLYARGLQPDWDALVPHTARTELPTYSWDRRHAWPANPPLGLASLDRSPPQGAGSCLDSAPYSTPLPGAGGRESHETQVTSTAPRPLGRGTVAAQPQPRGGSAGRLPPPTQRIDPAGSSDAVLFERVVDVGSLPWLSEHRVEGVALLPGTAYLEMAVSALRELTGDGAPVGVQVDDVELEEAMVFVGDARRRVQVEMRRQGPSWRFAVHSRPELEDAGTASSVPWVLHARGRVQATAHGDEAALGTVALDALMAACDQAHLDAGALYGRLADAGLGYGPAFRGVASLHVGDGDAVAELTPTDAVRREADAWVVHPAWLDAALHGLLPLLEANATEDGDDTGRAWVLRGIERMHVAAAVAPAAARVHLALRAHERGEAQREETVDITVFDADGRVLVALDGVRARQLAGADAHTTAAPPDGPALLEVRWVERDRGAALPEARAVDADAPWLVFGEAPGLAERLVEALRHAGRRADLVQAAPGEPNIDALKSRAWSGGVLVLVETRSSLAPEATSDGVRRLGELVQAIAASEAAADSRLVLVTDGLTARDGAPPEPLHHALWCMARTIDHELPGLAMRCVDIEATPDADAVSLEPLIDELCGPDGEREVVLAADGTRRVARLAPTQVESLVPRLAPVAGRPFELVAGRSLRELHLATCLRGQPAPGEVEIEIVAAGVNFSDVMKAAGIYPEIEPGKLPFGLECAGRVTAVGRDVGGLQLGDEVVAIAAGGAFARYAQVDARLVARKPARLDFAQAATLPAAYLTAWYGLIHLGRLAAGERVLIHSATGGVGMAAMALARRVGAEILATAGSPERRRRLRKMGIEHVFDSRSLEFAEQVLEVTDGQGVDVVLNSLSGDAIRRGLEITRSMGRFIELGRTDIYQDRRLGLGVFKKNVSYHVVDLGAAMETHPALLGGLLREIVKAVDNEQLEPLPHTRRSVTDAREVFTDMARARHLGKLVLDLEDPTAQVVAGTPEVHAFGGYVVTGGTGALGRVCARWLAERGAGTVVLVARSRPPAAVRDELRRLGAETGTRVVIAQADVRKRSALAAVLDRVRSEHGTVRGVIHAAGVLDDGLLVNQDADTWRRVLAPKVAGAVHLDALTVDDPLDFFVLFSSASAVIGSPGQAAYAAANGFLDGLAQRRQAQGRTALSIDWTAWTEVGLAAADARRGERLARRGLPGISPAEGIETLETLLAHDIAHIAALPIDAERYRRAFPDHAATPFFELLARPPLSASPTSRRSARSSSRDDSLERGEGRSDARRSVPDLRQFVRSQVADVLGLDAGEVGPRVPLASLGMDSLMSLELRGCFERGLGCKLPATLLWSCPTVDALVEHFAARSPSPTPPQEGGDVAAGDRGGRPADLQTLDSDALQAAIEHLPDDDVARLLELELAALQA